MDAFGTPTPYEQLAKITAAVAYAVDNQAQCIAGVALLHEIALHFDFDLNPRAVSMVAQVSGNPESTVITGDIAREYVESHGGPSRVRGYLGAPPDGSEFQRAGHLVATLDEPGIFLDPTFGQFTRAGLPDVVPVQAFDPSERDVLVRADWGQALYIFDDANTGWQQPYAIVRDASRSEAAVIADHLKAGGQPHTHSVRIA